MVFLNLANKLALIHLDKSNVRFQSHYHALSLNYRGTLHANELVLIELGF